MIDKGRYLNIPREQRLCTACNHIEDKIHVLDRCIKYKQIRSQIVNDHKVKFACPKIITKASDQLCIDNTQDVQPKYVFLCNNCNV